MPRLILFLVGDGVAPKISSSTKLFVVRNETLAISNAPKATHWASFLSFTTLSYINTMCVLNGVQKISRYDPVPY